MKSKLLALLLILSLAGLPALPARAQGGIRVTDSQATLTFPESVAFSAHIEAGAEIASVVLEYGVDQLTCGTVVAKAFPDFTPAASLDISWTWEMRQSGSLPPGAQLWWRWQVSDVDG